MKLTLKDLDRLQKNGVGGFTTIEEQNALIELAREGLQTARQSVQADGLVMRRQTSGDDAGN